MSERPDNEVVDIIFFKPSGKMYSSGTFTTSHYIFDDEFLLDIIDNQNVLGKDWFLYNDFKVVTISRHDSKFHHTCMIEHYDLRDAYHLREMKRGK